jgi:carboxypeptidase C (cathepsin A)
MKHGAVILLLALAAPALATSVAAGPGNRQSPDRLPDDNRSGERRWVRKRDESRLGALSQGPPSQPGGANWGTTTAPRRPRPGGPPCGRAAPECSVTEHTMLVQGRPIHYRATAGYLPIQRDSGQLLANIFFVAYERLDGGQETVGTGPRAGPEDQGGHQGVPPQNRPITFAFNGGPGASAVWLHMGAFGPKQALLANDGTALPTSNRLVDNEYTWLEFTDLVFVDPVGTGFSRPGPGLDADQFYEVQKDIEITADFVRLFVTQYERWLSPQFLAGESYGTARAVGAARRLQDRDGLYVNGLILLSSALNLGTISFDPGNDLPYALSLPSYTAVAQYHGKLSRRLEGTKVKARPAPGPATAGPWDRQSGSPNAYSRVWKPYLDWPSERRAAVLRAEGSLGLPIPRLAFGEQPPTRAAFSVRPRALLEAEQWALSEYLPALAQGRSLSPADSREIARRLAEYTGLSEDMIVQNHLRIATAGFAQMLLGREEQVLGLLDGRVTVPKVQVPRRSWIDPSLFIVEGPFVATFNSYVRTQLGFRTDRPYIFLSDKANESWNWGSARQGYFNIAPVLAEIIGLDNRLRVFAAAGYYDLTTPYLSQEYVFNHLGLPPGLEQNITFRHYHAGHQIYTSQDALRRLTDDVRAFVEQRDNGTME